MLPVGTEESPEGVKLGRVKQGGKSGCCLSDLCFGALNCLGEGCAAPAEVHLADFQWLLLQEPQGSVCLLLVQSPKALGCRGSSQDSF